MAKTLSLTKVSTTEVEITIYRNISEQVDSRSQSLLKSKSDFHVSFIQPHDDVTDNEAGVEN